MRAEIEIRVCMGDGRAVIVDMELGDAELELPLGDFVRRYFEPAYAHIQSKLKA